jgi:excisionase family DNA binding protein
VGCPVITGVAQRSQSNLPFDVDPGAEAAGPCIAHRRWSIIRRCGSIGQTWQTELNVGKGKAMADAEGEILTLDEVAAYLKAGKRTVYRLTQQGDIPAFKLGGTWRFRRTELNRWIAASIEKNPKQGNREARHYRRHQ